MATIRAYTTLEQSKKLAEILPLESADMCYPLPCEDGDKPLLEQGGLGSTPCWSLAALLEKLPYEVVDEEGTSRFFELYRGYMDKYYISYTGADEDIEGDYYDELVDACYDMIIKLNGLNLL